MKKNFLVLLLITVFSLILTGCSYYRTLIIFNNVPITKENVLSNASDFTSGKRIYYLFLTEKKLKTDLIRVRVLKKEGKGNIKDPVAIVYSNDFRLNKAQVYYYNDYIVINDTGEYCMIIYSRYALDKPLAIADFRVKG